jgi:L-alanine-DL-glutamate epimerase-like enolase superfamily enzyme
MKITKLECIPYTKPSKGPQRGAIPPRLQQRPIPPGPRGVFLKMYTDEGIVGFGDAGMASLGYAGDTVDSTIGFLKVVGPALLLGEDPRNIELLVAKMDRVAKYSRQAIGIVDCALHDIVGKKLGVPVYQLLGGALLKRVPWA